VEKEKLFSAFNFQQIYIISLPACVTEGDLREKRFRF